MSDSAGAKPNIAPGISAEMLEQARLMIGTWLRRDVHVPNFAEDISEIDIRRWAQYSMGDDNPLWSSDQYARGTRWGGVIAPPTFLYSVDSTIVAPGLPGVQWVYGGTRWENFLPVRIGDRVTARARVIAVEEKSGAHAQNFIVQTGEVLYTNQREELVARAEADVMRIPRRRSGVGIRGFEEREMSGRASYTPEEIDDIRLAYLNEERRGSNPRYWEDVAVGVDLSPVVKGPLTLVDIVAFYVGRRNTYAPLKLAFQDRERHPANVYISPTTGIPMHPAAGHFDDEIAREVGMPGAYDQGWMRANWVSHLVTNWCGDDGWVSKLGFRLKKPNLVGDTTWCHGKVVAKSVDASGNHAVELEIWGQTQRGERNVEGQATVFLPSRSVAR